MSSTKQKDVIEEIKEIIRDLGEGHKKAQIEMQEIREAQQEVAEAQKKTEIAQQEVAEAQKITEKSLQRLEKSLDKTNTRFNDKWGKFVENLIHGDLLKLLQGRKVDIVRIQPSMTYPAFNNNPAGQLDLVAVNGDELVIVEVKSTLDKSDVHHFIKKLRNFKEIPNEYKNKKIFGGVAYLEAVKKANEFAEKEGLFVIKAPGGETQVSTITNAESFKPKDFREE